MADIGDKGLTACDEMSEFGSKSSTKEEKQPMAGKITALDLAPAELSEAAKTYFAKCEEKLGLVPNVLLAYAFDETKLRAFTDIPSDGAVRAWRLRANQALR
jgi:hypothetical protein